jgi:hypothetical protein
MTSIERRNDDRRRGAKTQRRVGERPVAGGRRSAEAPRVVAPPVVAPLVVEVQRRINARLPVETARKLAYLQGRTGLGTTEIVLRSIERYYTEIQGEVGRPADVLSEAGFLGCADGPADLSSSYKDELVRSLRAKT